MTPQAGAAILCMLRAYSVYHGGLRIPPRHVYPSISGDLAAYWFALWRFGR